MPETSTRHPRVSVIVLAWKLTDELVACVAAIRAQEGDFDVEVVIVANAPSEAVLEAARSCAPDRLVESPVNLGFGGGCDRGVAESTGDYVVLLNDDTIVQPGWLSALLAPALDDPTIGAVASVLLDRDGTIQEAGRRVASTAGTYAVAGGMTPVEAREAGLLTERPVDYGSGAALLIRRQAYDAVGGFDRRYEPAYFEDVDLAFRLTLSGRRVVLAPEAFVVHASGLSTAGTSEFYREFLSWRSGRLFIERWAEVLEHAEGPEGDQLSLAPVAEFGVAERPAPGRSATGAPVVFAGLEDEFTAWALARLARQGQELAELRTLRAAERAELDHLWDDHRALQAAHHEMAQSLDALRARVDHFESNPLRKTARRVLGREAGGR